MNNGKIIETYGKTPNKLKFECEIMGKYGKSQNPMLEGIYQI